MPDGVWKILEFKSWAYFSIWNCFCIYF